MQLAAPKNKAAYLAILGPAGVLIVFFVIPFAIMILISFFERVEGGFYQPVLTLANYGRFFSLFFAKILGFSLMLAALIAAICVSIGVPFTYYLTQCRRFYQILWLIGLLAILSLSEVIIGFAWTTLFSRSAGFSNVLVALGVLNTPQAWSPSLFAVICALTYQALPFTILVLYPSCSRLDQSYVEAAGTMGAGPYKAFFNVVLPILQNTIYATFILVFIFALGSYLIPQILGQPKHWTLSVIITDQAIYQSNMPFAAAMATLLIGVSLGLIVISNSFKKRKS